MRRPWKCQRPGHRHTHPLELWVVWGPRAWWSLLEVPGSLQWVQGCLCIELMEL